MLKKCLISAIIVTTVAAIPLYLITNTLTAIQADSLTVLLIVTALVGFCAALIATRLPDGSASSGKTRKRNPRPSGPREQGRVKWFNAAKGFGFITRDSGDDIFVHFRAIRGDGHRVLKDGQRVEFHISESEKGLQAEDVASLRG